MGTFEQIYGKYSVPIELRKLFELEAELQNDGCSLAEVWLRLEEDNFRYAITPPDLITFASTGGDGIHFGFLTDFGQVENLEEAYIVCVSPTNDPPLNIVARNVNEFLRLIFTVKDPESLDDINRLQDEEKYFHELNEDLLSGEFGYRVNLVMEKLRDKFKLEHIDNVFAYITRIRAERAKLLIMNTLDGLGIRKSKYNLVDPKPYDFHSTKNLEHMKEYLTSAALEEKLCFFRDANYKYILDDDYDKDVKQLVLDEMHKMGLQDEVTRFT